MTMKRAELVFVIEASGSMYPFIKDIKKCYYSILNKYEQEYDECYVSVITFNNEVKRIVNHINIKEVPFLQYYPDGGKALLDAVGIAIRQTVDEIELSKEKFDNASIIIISNGVDDSSKYYTAKDIENLILLYRKKYSLHFIFSATNTFFTQSKGVILI